MASCLTHKAGSANPDEQIEKEALKAKRKAYELHPDEYIYASSLVCYLGYLGRIYEAEEVLAAFGKTNNSRSSTLQTRLDYYRKNGSTRGKKNEKCY